MRHRQHASSADRQRAYRERKRNAETAQSVTDAVTFDDLFRTVPTVEASDKNENYTPRWVIDAARAVLGGIDLDPASCAAAQALVGATRYYTKADDGLNRPWAGRVWCNPPYNDPLPWVKKLIAHYRAHEVTTSLLLLNVAGSPEWAQLLWSGGYPVCIFASRIEFHTPVDREKKGNKYDSFVWYFGRRPGRFSEVFARYGAIR